MDKVSYALGLGIGHQLKQMGANDLSVDDFAQAIKDVLKGNDLKVDNTEAKKIVEEFFAKQEEKTRAAAAEAGKLAKKVGEDYLAENSKKEGVVVLPSGLQYKVIKEGNGKKPKLTDKVKCHYEGTFVDGEKFDSSYDRKQPAVFGVNQVIPGWTEALQLMSEGSEWMLYIPYNLGYGEAGAQGAIPPYAALIFKVELIEVL